MSDNDNNTTVSPENGGGENGDPLVAHPTRDQLQNIRDQVEADGGSTSILDLLLNYDKTVWYDEPSQS